MSSLLRKLQRVYWEVHLQNSMIAGKRNCQQKQDPVACQEQKKAEYSLQNKLRQYPPVDVSRRHERIHLVNLQVR
jgi:hypothetical protein